MLLSGFRGARQEEMTSHVMGLPTAPRPGAATPASANERLVGGYKIKLQTALIGRHLSVVSFLFISFILVFDARF